MFPKNVFWIGLIVLFLGGCSSPANISITQTDVNSTGSGTTYTANASPVVVDNDDNKIGLNVLGSSDWNGLFDGQEGAYYSDFQNARNKYNTVQQDFKEGKK